MTLIFNLVHSSPRYRLLNPSPNTHWVRFWGRPKYCLPVSLEAHRFLWDLRGITFLSLAPSLTPLESCRNCKSLPPFKFGSYGKPIGTTELSSGSTCHPQRFPRNGSGTTGKAAQCSACSSGPTKPLGKQSMSCLHNVL
jgi:hypothetical protein